MSVFVISDIHCPHEHGHQCTPVTFSCCLDFFYFSLPCAVAFLVDQSIGSEVGFHGAQNTSEGHTSRESMQAPGPLSTSVHRTKGQKRRHADAASGIAGQADLVPATLAMPSVSGDSGATGKSKKKKRKDSVSSYSSPSYEVPSTTAKSPSLSKPTVGFNVPAASSNVHAAPVRRKGSRSKSQDSTETTSSGWYNVLGKYLEIST